MELIIFIVAIALAYHYMVRKPKHLQVLFSGLPKQNNVKFRRLLFRQSKMITIILST